VLVYASDITVEASKIKIYTVIHSMDNY